MTDRDDGWLRDGSTEPGEVKDYYDTMAADYDATLSSWNYDAPTHVAGLLFQHGVNVSSIFDAGCGTGLAGAALRSQGFTGTIDGVDLSPSSLEEAERRGVYTSVGIADLQQRLPFEDAAFDAVVCVGVLTYVPDVDSCWREFCRVTRAGGLVVFTQRDDMWQARDCATVAREARGRGPVASDLGIRAFVVHAKPRRSRRLARALRRLSGVVRSIAGGDRSNSRCSWPSPARTA